MNTFGESIKITIFGEPHGPAVGMVLDGLPPGEEISEEQVLEELRRRAPGSSELGAAREEEGEPVYSSGIFNGRTTGAPICALIRNGEQDSQPCSPNLPRPGHADYAAGVRYRGFSDYRGGGPFSGRLTVPLVVAGAVCRQILARRGVSISSCITQVGSAAGQEIDFAMKKEILDARASGDSVGAVVECRAEGVPPGLGGLMFSGLESRLSALIFAMPGVKGLEFGAGFELASMRGSRANDPIRAEGGRVFTETNNSGGLDGGLTNGMPLILRCALRPTPSISREQKTVDLATMENITMRLRGRSEPCPGPPFVPVLESAVAFCLLDAMCGGAEEIRCES